MQCAVFSTSEKAIAASAVEKRTTRLT